MAVALLGFELAIKSLDGRAKTFLKPHLGAVLLLLLPEVVITLHLHVF